MSDDKLQLTAVVTDKASGPLRAIQREMANLSRSSGLTQLSRDFGTLHGITSKFGTELRSIVLPALGSLGISTGGAVATITLLAGRMRDLGARAVDMKNLSRETGIGMAQIKALGRAAEDVRLDGVEGGLRSFANTFYEIRNRIGGTRGGFANLLGGQEFLDELDAAKDGTAGLQVAIGRMNALYRQGSFNEAGILSSMLFGSRGYERLSPAEIERYLKTMGSGLDEMVRKWTEYYKATNEFNHAASELQRTFMAPMIGPFTEAMKELEKIFQDGDFKSSIESVAKSIGQVGIDAAKALPGFIQDLRETKAWFEWLEQKNREAGNAVGRFLGTQGADGNPVVREDPRPGILDELRRRRAVADQQAAGAAAHGLDAAQFAGERARLDEQIRRMEKAIKDGAAEGIREGLTDPGTAQKMSYQPGGGVGYSGPMSGVYGGGRYRLPVPGYGGGNGGGSDAASHPFVRSPLNSGGGAGARGEGGGLSMGGDKDGSPSPLAGALGSNARLAGIRKSLFDGLDKNPALKRFIIQAGLAEGPRKNLQANIEQMANYAAVRGFKDFNSVLRSGFYGPVNRGEAQRRKLTAADIEAGEKALAAVQGGSNQLEYRSDQGLWSDPGGRMYARNKDYWGYKNVNGNNFFYYYEPGRKWAMRQQELDELAASASRGRTAMHRNFVRQANPGLHATGKLSVDVKAPPGTTVAAEGGGLFQNTEVRRHRQMQPTDVPAATFGQ